MDPFEFLNDLPLPDGDDGKRDRQHDEQVRRNTEPSFRRPTEEFAFHPCDYQDPNAATAADHSERQADDEIGPAMPPNPSQLPRSVLPLVHQGVNTMIDGLRSESAKGIFAIVAAVCAVVILLVGLTFAVAGDAIQGLWAEHKARQEAERLEQEDRRQYEQLESDIAETIRLVEDAANQIDLDRKSLSARAAHQLGTPIEHLAVHPEQRPRDIDLEILRSEMMAMHWAGLTNTLAHRRKDLDVHLAVQDLQLRLEQEQLRQSDRRTALDLLHLVALRERLSARQYEHLQRFIRHMECRHMERYLDSWNKE
jgi:hypothetical protein